MYNRKPRLPVEMELKCEEEVEEDIFKNEAEEVEERKEVEKDQAEEIFGRMLKMRQMMFDNASQNIHKSQERYKKDYDKKRSKTDACIVIIVIIMVHNYDQNLTFDIGSVTWNFCTVT